MDFYSPFFPGDAIAGHLELHHEIPQAREIVGFRLFPDHHPPARPARPSTASDTQRRCQPTQCRSSTRFTEALGTNDTRFGGGYEAHGLAERRHTPGSRVLRRRPYSAAVVNVVTGEEEPEAAAIVDPAVQGQTQAAVVNVVTGEEEPEAAAIVDPAVQGQTQEDPVGQDLDAGDDVWQDQTSDGGHYSWEWCGPDE